MSPGSLRSGGLALDIGASSVSVLRLSGSEGRVKLRDYFEAPLPDGLVVDGEIVDADLLARELRLVVKRWGLRGRAVQVGVSNQKVIVRNIEMPEMTEEEMRGALEYQAQDYIPIPLEDAVVDFQVLGPRVGPDGTRRLEVLLVAAQRQMIEMLLDSLRQSGLKVAGIDICALALVRALLSRSSVLPGLAEPEVCRGIVDISSSVSTLAVAQGGILRFSRVINFSSDRFARSVAERRGIPLTDAMMLVERIGLEGPGSTADELYSLEVLQETRQLLGRIAAELSGEIKRSFDYYQSQEHGMPVSALILSGRGALIPNLDVHLGETLRIPVRIADPLVQVAQNASKLSDTELARIAPCLSVLIGLALPEGD